jgi:hypothetical protein
LCPLELLEAEEVRIVLSFVTLRFAIVCGDLVNHMPSMYPTTDPEIRTRQVNDFKVIQSDVPLILAPMTIQRIRRFFPPSQDGNDVLVIAARMNGSV